MCKIWFGKKGPSIKDVRKRGVKDKCGSSKGGRSLLLKNGSIELFGGEKILSFYRGKGYLMAKNF